MGSRPVQFGTAVSAKPAIAAPDETEQHLVPVPSQRIVDQLMRHETEKENEPDSQSESSPKGGSEKKWSETAA